MSTSHFPDNDTLWREICDLYARHDAAARCLRAQDGYGLCITLLLLAIAISQRGIAIHPGAAADLRKLTTRWHFNVLMPLRAARRALKDTDADAWDKARQLELAVERGLLDEACAAMGSRALWNADDALTRNLALIVEAHGDDPPTAVYAVADNLGRLLSDK